MVIHVGLFVAVGVLLGPIISRQVVWLIGGLTRKAGIGARVALFAGVMLALACILWFMAEGR